MSKDKCSHVPQLVGIIASCRKRFMSVNLAGPIYFMENAVFTQVHF